MLYNCSRKGSITIILRKLSFLLLSIALLGCQPRANSAIQPAPTLAPGLTVLGQREYAVHQRITLVNEGDGQPEKQNIWVALIRDFPPYQDVLSMEISPGDYVPITDENGNTYAQFDFSGQPSGTTRTVSIDYRLVVNELAYDLAACQGSASEQARQGEIPDDFTQPELHIESANAQIKELASQLSRSQVTVCQQVRSFYDYITENLTYTFNGENWGAQAALGPMGADCTEYTALFIALSRSQGIPARYFEGLLYLDQDTDELAKIEHAWSDTYLPAVGWAPSDPTLGRIPANRETYFTHYTPDHIIVSLGASPSVLRGSSYWTHLYWPGNSTKIRVQGDWQIELINVGGQ